MYSANAEQYDLLSMLLKVIKATEQIILKVRFQIQIQAQHSRDTDWIHLIRSQL